MPVHCGETHTLLKSVGLLTAAAVRRQIYAVVTFWGDWQQDVGTNVA